MTLNQIPPQSDDVGVEQQAEERITATGTWTKPDGVNYVEIILVGGGGAGGSRMDPAPAPGYRASAGGGGGGGIVRRNVPVSGPVPVTIGSGGVATPHSTLNSNGGDTIWDSGPTAITAFGGGAGGHAITPFGPLNAGSPGATGGGGGGVSIVPFGGPSVAGAGGGAVSAARNFNNLPAVSPEEVGGSGTQGGAGTHAGDARVAPDASPANAKSKLSVGGLGWNGLGGGGGGSFLSVGQSGGGTRQPASFIGAFANSGGGGAGVATNPATPGNFGQTGGSGVVIVRYNI